ncbi:MAG: type VI secretion system baseplate subunit TssK [Formivibrio sp.]|nr:type VI secretion system baseplate subunit TssK [Formivibrio sp.]
MVQAQRVLWGEGMFLRPQHFQQQVLFIEQALAGRMTANAWGVRRVDVDCHALKNGLLQLDALSLVFQDGFTFDAPRSEHLPLVRNLNELPQLGSKTVVYACLPALNAFGGNTLDVGQEAQRPTRFMSERTMASDLYTRAIEAEVTALRAQVRLMLEEENRDGYYCVPIASIGKDATGNWILDEDFIPPLVELAGSRPLNQVMRRLLDILLVKSQTLSAMHRERTGKVMEFGTSDIASFWLLHTVNRNFPLLSHFLRQTDASPESLYLTLAQMAGELITFSSSHSLADIPAYRHEDLTPTFSRLDALVRELLGTVISTRYAVIPLSSPKASFHIGLLESDRLIEDVDYYLSVQSELPLAQVIETVPFKLKVGAPDDVEKILNSALPGVRLVYAAQTPSAIPVRVGNHYFSFDPHGQIFERMQKSRSICIYVPQALAELKLELIAVFR